jgi:UDPglucose--hexose-1-phosphate uridylyltransferase
VLVSPHRTKRPWQGQQETVPDGRPAYDPKCYLCPGNTRAGGLQNPPYTGTYVFENDFAALLEVKPDEYDDPSDTLFRRQPVAGTSRVICFHPRHDLTLPQMQEHEIVKVIESWIDQTRELGEKYRWVQVFENKGAVMGCSNPHPHGQIWASDFVPNEPAAEDSTQRAYHRKQGSPMLVDYARREIADLERVVASNDQWVAVVPFWAVWPYEVLLLPIDPVQRLTELESSRQTDLAAILKQLLTRFDNLFHTSFPYSMGWHGAPFVEGNHDHWQLHAHFYPPLLRSATVKKFMVGYEMLAEAQRDLTPEQAAATLRAVSV